LLRLSELTFSQRYAERADRTLAALRATLTNSPSALSEMLLALDFRDGSPKEIVIVAPNARSDAEPFLAVLRRTYLPNRVLAVAVVGKDQETQSELVPTIAAKLPKGGKATAYVCEKQTCELPTTEPSVFAQQITKVRTLR
ncbi:MAG TPA: hypothetical protein VNO21_05655, partial [Polyangiaceae bacterium]|nr:hypothetical protein [Polyangiaceae bacterium]